MRSVLSISIGALMVIAVLLSLRSTVPLRPPDTVGGVDGPFGAGAAASPSTAPANTSPAPVALPPPPPDESRALAVLKRIDAAEVQYFAATQTYGRLDELAAATLIENRIASATLPSTAYYGYMLRLAVLPPAPAPSYYLEAIPTDSSTGPHAFYTDETGGTYHGTTPSHTHAAPGQGPSGFTPAPG